MHFLASLPLGDGRTVFIFEILLFLALFIAVGPPAFIALTSISMAKAWPVTVAFFGVGGQARAHMLELLTTIVAGFIWSLAFGFFCITVMKYLQ
jgi:hypothetical protein